ncbi:hypothetical protein ACSQ67_017298 [Phaseolus vulgaris]
MCTFSTIGFADTTIGITIYNGKKIDRTSVSYSLQGSSVSKFFKAFNALGTIAFSFGDAMLPEIQVSITFKSLTWLHVFFCLSIVNNVLVCGCVLIMILDVVVVETASTNSSLKP